MKTKHGLLFGFALIALAAIFTFAGCDDGSTDNGGGGSDGISISGTPKVGQTLTAKVTANGKSFGEVYWKHSVDNSTSTYSDDFAYPFGDTFTLTDAQLGKYIFAHVYIHDGGNSATYYSNVLGPVTAAGGNPGTGGELWEKFTTAKTAATATAWKKDGSDITLTFYYDETDISRGYANLYYTTTVYNDFNHDLYVKLNSASSWFLGKLDSSKNIAFNGSSGAGTVTFASATSMTIAGIDAQEDESMYNGTYTKQQ